MAVPENPITREEQYLAAGLDGGDLPDPITREEQYLYEIATKMQGGGSSVTVEPLTVTQNGTTTAPSGKAYSPVTTNVPNSYGASDEGKVVNNGALVAQTAHAPVTANGTIDTTLNNSVTVNVEGNPNAVETISGTLGNPWGGRFAAIRDAVEVGDATAYITYSGTKAYASIETISGLSAIKQVAFSGLDPVSNVDEWGFEFVRFLYDYSDGSVVSEQTDPYMWAGESTASNRWGGSDLSASASCTLTIIHHPMTGSLTPAGNQTFGGNV